MTDNRVHVFSNDALGDLDASGIAERIASREVSAREVMEACIARAQDADEKLRGLACDDFERALSCSDIGHGGVFAGVPTAIKDNASVAGLPTQFGTTSFTAAQDSADGRFVRHMLDTGLIPIGKTRLPEFAFNVTSEFTSQDPVRNPWDPRYSTGGSSGGAAALVAAGVVPIAHATDAGGSIRIPAAACGLVGLKPSRGRTVLDPADKAMPVRIAVQGVLTRSVRDTARLMSAVEGSYCNPRLRSVRAVEGASRTRLRIGVLPDSPTTAPVDSETRASVLASADLLESLGHHVEETSLAIAPDFMRDYALYLGMLASALVTAGKRLTGTDFDRDELGTPTSGLAQMYRRTALQTPLLLLRLRQLRRRYAATFDNYDVLLSPVVAHTTPRIGVLSPDQDFDSWFEKLLGYDCFAPLNNISGTPAISLPLHQTASGLPLASQLSASLGNDRTLLELAFELEQAQPWNRIHTRN